MLRVSRLTGFGIKSIATVDRLARKFGKLPTEILALDIEDLLLNITLSEKADELMLKEIRSPKTLDDYMNAYLKRFLEMT